MEPSKPTDEDYMRVAFEEARVALKRREVPVGCAFVDMRSGQVILRASNRTNATYNPTAHAEVVGIDRILAHAPTRKEGLELLRNCELYVTVEPCIMCAGALARVGISRVVFGCSNSIFGGCGSVVAVHEGSVFRPGPRHTPFDALGGVLEDDAVDLLRYFYSRGNVRAPRPQRPVVASPPGAPAPGDPVAVDHLSRGAGASASSKAGTKAGGYSSGAGSEGMKAGAGAGASACTCSSTSSSSSSSSSSSGSRSRSSHLATAGSQSGQVDPVAGAGSGVKPSVPMEGGHGDDAGLGTGAGPVK